MIDDYLNDLAEALQVRVLLECREHLIDAAAERGEAEAVRPFGAAPDIAAALDAEVASRRGCAPLLLVVIGVLVTGGSTLALINHAESGVQAPAFWAAEHATLGGTAVTAAIEVAPVLACVAVLGMRSDVAQSGA